jgi:hypothetical protein
MSWLHVVVLVGVLWLVVSIPVALAVARVVGTVSPVGRSDAPPAPAPEPQRRPPLVAAEPALPERV